MAHNLIDGTILQFCDNTHKRILCTACPRTLSGAYRAMELCFAKKHTESARHKRHVEKAINGWTASLNPVFKAQQVGKSLQECNLSTRKHEELGSFGCFMDANDFSMEMDVHDAPDTMDFEIPLSKFLDDVTRSRMKLSPLDKFLSQHHLPPSMRRDELVDYSAPDFGIEFPDNDPASTRATLNTVTPDNTTYPWPSKADFVTALLFSSLRLPFSDAQKKAVLNWAKELGARDVPSLYATKKCQTLVEDLVGQPTEKVTARSRNTFYINKIVKAIAHDYGNPLTCFVMQDYPEDGREGMSQVFNGKNMLLDLPSPPAARVDGKAGFIVNDEQEIIPTSMFVQSYEDIASMGELDCGLTASSVQYASLAPNPLCEKAQGQMVYAVPLILFMDNISGNISKQWNKHHAVYMSNANLPHEMLEKEFFVCFITSSPHAVPMELM
ncbi:hypothetical protein F4604DRAFT_1924992 [Suillus subluteus]|nr:hypothetical protein F4604DRAFT_1924992 [Suillus subluteus]